MAKQVKSRGGTTVQSSSFTGADREVTVDTTLYTLRVHDGSTAGGHIVSLEPDEQLLTGYTIATTVALPATTDTVNEAIGKLALSAPTNSTPASASATGAVGTIVWDTSYIYVCIATNTWKRSPLSTW